MYKNLYKKASEMADLIQENVAKPESRTASKFIDQASQGLVRRRQEAVQQVSADSDEGIASLISGYISNIRQNNPADAIEEYLTEVDREPSDRPSGTFDFGDVSDFAERLAMSESSGQPGVQISTQSGGKEQSMTGLFQFSDDRLTDYMNDTGASFTTEDFRLDPDLQKDVFAWHISDIDRVINTNNLLDKGYDLDGLRAVAHLGGVNGMLRYVRSDGRYNPSDEFGTSLQDYYNRFSG
jgi:hypothetical protein